MAFLGLATGVHAAAQDKEPSYGQLKMTYVECVRTKSLEAAKTNPSETAKDIVNVVSRGCGWDAFIERAKKDYNHHGEDLGAPYVAEEYSFRDALIEEVAIEVLAARMNLPK